MNSNIKGIFIFNQLKLDRIEKFYTFPHEQIIIIKSLFNYAAPIIAFIKCLYRQHLLLSVNLSSARNKLNKLIVIIQRYLSSPRSNFLNNFKIIIPGQKLNMYLVSCLAFHRNYFFSKNLYGDKSASLKVDFIQCSGSKS